ncbi:small GTP-binding protein [Histomonas meleagridis]|uniref:small GTP-binding protein n=1 Tax=Histomonas meleagridis TaxID=135588 RepID=UPI00355A3490|nr:small GTP-binding protein [Histomonas meleagridis]KAH0806025.1 small GTP-binding protein [Histomonas meleagridis]
MAPTVGSNFEITDVNINGQTVSLRIWDTAGQEQYQSIMPVYLKGSQVAVIVASIVDHLSIANIDKWIDLLNKTEMCKFIVVINKIDLQDNINIVDEIRGELTDKYQDVMFVSAKTGSGIKDLFYTIAKTALIESETEGDVEHKNGVNIANSNENQTRFCC